MARIKIEDLEADKTGVGAIEAHGIHTGHPHPMSRLAGNRFRASGGGAFRENPLEAYLRDHHRSTLK